MEDVPMLEANEDGSVPDLEKAFDSLEGSGLYRNDRERPYNGQPWTDQGIRGQTEIKGITFRDLCDCIVQAMLVCSNNPEHQKSVFEINDEFKNTKYAAKGTWRSKDIYNIDFNDIDPGAIIQNVGCFVEHYMGIFPNLPDKIKGNENE